MYGNRRRAIRRYQLEAIANMMHSSHAGGVAISSLLLYSIHVHETRRRTKSLLLASTPQSLPKQCQLYFIHLQFNY